MKLGILKETYLHEARVALTPEIVQKLLPNGYEIMVESGAGTLAGYTDEAYLAAGAKLETKSVILQSSSILVTVSPLAEEDISAMKDEATLIGILKPFSAHEAFAAYNKRKLTTFTLDRIPRITRAQSMDVMSSQSNLAGYRAVIEGAEKLGRALPLMMTAAGTIRPAKVLILGAGVAGLQAIATAKRLGAVVSAFDVRPVAKEQVESLGAVFVEVSVQENGDGVGGYAQEMSETYKEAQMALLAEVIKTQDIVISTALIPGKQAPILITEAMVQSMQPNSVIVDLAAEAGGNCTLSQHGKTYTKHGVIVYAPYNILSHIAYNASQTYARNVYSFLTGAVKVQDETLEVDMTDEIISAVLLTRDGHTVNPLFATQKGETLSLASPKEESKAQASDFIQAKTANKVQKEAKPIKKGTVANKTRPGAKPTKSQANVLNNVEAKRKYNKKPTK